MFEKCRNEFSDTLYTAGLVSAAANGVMIDRRERKWIVFFVNWQAERFQPRLCMKTMIFVSSWIRVLRRKDMH